jgi:APA family basic amino acid/polyamine antiporter
MDDIRTGLKLAYAIVRSTVPESATSPPGLRRSIRGGDLVAVVLNGVIGAGIFGLPAKAYGLAGDYSLFAFGLCALCVIVIVLSFAEVGSRSSSSGGPYLYAREAFGGVPGFIVGWLVWISRVSGFAANTAVLIAYVAYFYKGASMGVTRAVLVTAVVLLITALNVRGVRTAATVSNTFGFGKLIPLVVFVIFGLFAIDSSRFAFSYVPDYRSFSQAVMLLVYGFTGFEMAAIPAAEILDPQRTLPRALLAGIALVVTLYVLIQAVCIGTLPNLAASDRPLADAAARFLGPAGAILIMVGVLISLAGNLNILTLSASRVLFAMGENGDLPAVFASVHPVLRTPVPAILMTAAAMLALTLSGTFTYLLTISTVSRLVAYLATCGALPLLRGKPDPNSRAFVLRAGVPVALAGVTVCIWLLFNSTPREARDTALATAVGLTLHWLSRARKAGAAQP